MSQKPAWSLNENSCFVTCWFNRGAAYTKALQQAIQLVKTFPVLALCVQVSTNGMHMKPDDHDHSKFLHTATFQRLQSNSLMTVVH